jgi:hypothetical protein
MRKRRRAGGMIIGVLLVLAPLPAPAQLFDPYIIGMMAGPVSDGPSILLLKKRGERFLSTDTLAIACSAGAASGVVAHGLPAIAMAASGVAAPVSLAALAGTSLFGCAVGAGAGLAAMATQLTLDLIHHLAALAQDGFAQGNRP